MIVYFIIVGIPVFAGITGVLIGITYERYSAKDSTHDRG